MNLLHIDNIRQTGRLESKYVSLNGCMTKPVAARSKASVCGRSLAEIAGSNPAGDMVICRVWILCVVR